MKTKMTLGCLRSTEAKKTEKCLDELDAICAPLHEVGSSIHGIIREWEDKMDASVVSEVDAGLHE